MNFNIDYGRSKSKTNYKLHIYIVPLDDCYQVETTAGPFWCESNHKVVLSRNIQETNLSISQPLIEVIKSSRSKYRLCCISTILS